MYLRYRLDIQNVSLYMYLDTCIEILFPTLVISIALNSLLENKGNQRDKLLKLLYSL